MKKNIFLFALMTSLFGCKDDSITTVTPIPIFSMSLEFKTLNEGLALVRSLDSDPDQIDSLTTNKLPYVAVFQISTKTDFSDYNWYVDEASLFRALPSGIKDDFQDYSFMPGYWKKTADGDFVHYGVILLNDRKFSTSNLPWKSVKDIQADESISAIFEGMLVNSKQKISKSIIVTWKAKK